MQALPRTFRSDAEAAAGAVVVDPVPWGSAVVRFAVVEVLQERTLRVDRVLAAVVTERPADLNLSQV